MLHAYAGRRPQIHPRAYVQQSAQLVGDVVVGAESSVWFNVVIRGDLQPVRIGERTNVQDNSTIHITRDRAPTLIGNDVTVGHGAIVHGCTVGDRCLIGMGAIVMDGAVLGADCLVAAGALVPPGTAIPDGHLIVGHPARAQRPLRVDELDFLRNSAANYIEYAATYRAAGI
jgi:carbonic anhydrase/acetyltransferase-like protein (isoleucine patch superfamily)